MKPSKQKENRKDSEQKQTSVVTCNPSPHLWIAAERQGYDEIEKALMEYVDNSVDAITQMGEAFSGQIEVLYLNWGDLEKRKIVIVDNGCGMDPDKIAEIAFSFGVSGKKFSELQIGCFGIGSKYSLASIADRCTMISKTKNDKEWGLASISISQQLRENKFVVETRKDTPEINREVEKYKMLSESGHGSIVILSNIKEDCSINNTLSAALTKMHKECQRIYRYRIMPGGVNENLTISFSGGKAPSKEISKETSFDWVGIKKGEVEGSEGTDWYLGGPDGEFYNFDYKGHTVGIRLGHTPCTQGPKLRSHKKRTMWAHKVYAGNYPKACSYIRGGREIQIVSGNTSSLAAFWVGLNNMVSNMYMEVKFDDDPTKKSLIKSDSGKKTISIDAGLSKYLKELAAQAMDKIDEKHKTKVVSSKNTKDVLDELEECASRTYKNKRKSSVGSAVASKLAEKKNKIDKAENSDDTSKIKLGSDSKYVGKSVGEDALSTLTSAAGVKSSFVVQEVQVLNRKYAPWWRSVSPDGVYTININQANDFVKWILGPASKDPRHLVYPMAVFMSMAQNFFEDEESYEDFMHEQGAQLSQMASELERLRKEEASGSSSKNKK